MLAVTDKEKPKLSVAKQKCNNIIEATVREQSRKPDELYNLIERLFPNGTFLELFGRMHNSRTGWTTVGLEIDEREFID